MASYDPEHYQKNKAQILAYHQKYRENNRDKERLRHKIYRQNNLARHADYERKRRAKKRELLHEAYTTEQVLETYGTSCFICGEEIDLEAPRRTGYSGWEMGLHIDHLESLCNNGADTLENVRPTRGSCNLSKNRYQLQTKE